MDYYEEKAQERIYNWRACGISFVGIIIILFTALFCSCATKVITIPETHTEYIVRTDSFVQRDTIEKDRQTIVRELTADDSLLLSQYGIRLKENERMLLLLQRELERERTIHSLTAHDTIIQRDTIPYKVEVDKSLTWWQRQKIAFGELAIVVMVGLLCILLIRIKLL